jgi:hypothetical protein
MVKLMWPLMKTMKTMMRRKKKKKRMRRPWSSFKRMMKSPQAKTQRTRMRKPRVTILPVSFIFHNRYLGSLAEKKSKYKKYKKNKSKKYKYKPQKSYSSSYRSYGGYGGGYGGYGGYSSYGYGSGYGGNNYNSAGCSYFKEVSSTDSKVVMTAMKGNWSPKRVYLKCCTSWFKRGCTQSTGYTQLTSYIPGMTVVHAQTAAQTTTEATANCSMLKKVEETDASLKYTGLYKGKRLWFKCCGWTEWSGCNSRFWYSYLTAATPKHT